MTCNLTSLSRASTQSSCIRHKPVSSSIIRGGFSYKNGHVFAMRQLCDVQWHHGRHLVMTAIDVVTLVTISRVGEFSIWLACKNLWLLRQKVAGLLCACAWLGAVFNGES